MADDFLVRDSRQPGHFWADNEVYDVFGPELGSHGFAVYMALCRNAMNGTGECRIAMSRVATQLRIGKATVHQAMHRIVDLGLAQLIAAGGPRATALYLLADVKSLTDPSYAQMRLSSVRLQNAKADSVRLRNASVRISNATGLEPNAAFAHRTPYKESKTSLQDLQDSTKRKAFDLPAANRPAGEIPPVSSSRKSDDDTGENSTALAKVLQAFEDSPVTTGKANANDRRTAAEFLRLYPVEKIEYGILLATARRMGTPQFEESTAKVRSLAYFADAIEEACSDEHINFSYAQYLKHAIQRREGVAPLPKKAGVHA